MCGIAGFIDRAGPHDEFAARLKAMTDALRHRGPDGEGLWLEGPVALGHRRLAIVDLSPSGAQPMESASGRYVITYNGEIYNHGELRKMLSARNLKWRGTSDTEALLAAIDEWGLEVALQHCVGMFAFALWDRKERRLTLARDRFGEKPLYFGWQRGVFLFGSELKALRPHPAFEADISSEALAEGHHSGLSLWETGPPAWLRSQPYGVGATLLDLYSYLPEDVLVKVDRASMAVSLESRAPLLDHRVARFAFSLPWRFRGGRGGNEKAVLRRLLHRYVPPALVDRPKMGFSLPVSQWLRRKELLDWGESLIINTDTLSDGRIDAAKLRLAWQEHLTGAVDRAGLLWSTLMFLDWKRGA